MTQVALRSVLAAVNIGMTLLALLAYIREHWIRIAFLALHFRMQAAQRKTGFGVLDSGMARMGVQPCEVWQFSHRIFRRP
jgi:hypothetical protein